MEAFRGHFTFQKSEREPKIVAIRTTMIGSDFCLKTGMLKIAVRNLRMWNLRLVKPMSHMLALGLIFAAKASGQSTLPFVAVHDSELTRALENMSAVPPTPTGAGTTGNQWWPTDWHYF